MLRKMISIICVLIMMVTFAQAASPYKTYVYTDGGSNVEITPDAYTLKKVYIGADFGVGNFNNPNDIFIDKQENVYIVDTNNNRLVVLDPSFRHKFTIKEFTENEKRSTFNKPKGVFVTLQGDIYVADTDNNRIVQFNSKGEHLRTLGKPEITVLDTEKEKFVYKPISLVVDSAGRIYVICTSVLMGIIQLSSDGIYEGFIGAQKVSYNPLEYLWKQFLTEKQVARMKSYVPTEYNNIVIDRKDFLYVTTSAINSGDLIGDIQNPSKTPRVSPIKKLNPSGDDVLKRTGDMSIAGDLLFQGENNMSGQSVIVDVALGDSQTFTLLDNKRSRYFTYSREGEMLYAFGVKGNQSGNTMSPVAITYKGTDFLSLDKETGKVTIYKRTKYGDLIYTALDNYNNYRFDAVVENWKDVLKINSNLNLAYTGIGKSLIKEKKYKEAMEYFKISSNFSYYSQAYKEYRSDIFEKYFILFIMLIILAIILITKLFQKIAKANKEEKYKHKRQTLFHQILYAFYILFHPFDGFWDLKHEKRGNVLGGTIILILATVTNILQMFFSGYLFTPVLNSEVSTFLFINSIFIYLLPVGLWTLANWCLTTLMDGEGSLKDIYRATTYSLLPIIIIGLPMTVISHFMTVDEASILGFFNLLAYIWTILLVVSGSMITHRYSFSKNIVTSGLSVAGIGIIMFLILITLNIVERMWIFIDSVIKEIAFRI